MAEQDDLKKLVNAVKRMERRLADLEDGLWELAERSRMRPKGALGRVRSKVADRRQRTMHRATRAARRKKTDGM